MKMRIQAACGCVVGKIRKRNEDNIVFDGALLDAEHGDLEPSVPIEGDTGPGIGMAVFDGIGGEYFGEVASWAAARELEYQLRQKWPVRPMFGRRWLERLVRRLDSAVIMAQKEKGTSRMGSTMVGLFLRGRDAYLCNVGDSRGYRFRQGCLTRLTEDHVQTQSGKRKPPLTQYLGYGSEDMLLSPYIIRERSRKGDVFLLCSDGLTDMVPEEKIRQILEDDREVQACVEELIGLAMAQGGRDNCTVIICKMR